MAFNKNHFPNEGKVIPTLISLECLFGEGGEISRNYFSLIQEMAFDKSHLNL